MQLAGMHDDILNLFHQIDPHGTVAKMPLDSDRHIGVTRRNRNDPDKKKSDHFFHDSILREEMRFLRIHLILRFLEKKAINNIGDYPKSESAFTPGIVLISKIMLGLEMHKIIFSVSG
jgi:hypothetical protein